MRLTFLTYFKYRTLIKIMVFIIPLAIMMRVYWPQQPVAITFTALRWDAKLDVINEQERNTIVEAMRYTHKMRKPGPPKQLALYSMLVEKGNQQQEYLVTESGEYFFPDGTAILPSYKLREIFKQYADRLERQSPFGQPMAWSEARRIFSRYTKATIEDLDTGLRFEVQRRAGNYHADVQPLTANDTAVLKEIYDGNWSWKRRAVIVEVGNTRLAASMAGMPHGAGAIRNNNFNGHFCVHFKDSTTHQTPKQPNLAHQIMVWKAAGRLPELLAMASPEEVIEIFFTALNQQAPDICLLTLAGEPKLDDEEFRQKSREVAALAYSVQRYDPQTNIITVQIQLDYLAGPQNVKKELDIQMVHSLGYWWKIDPRSLTELYHDKTTANFNDLLRSEAECL
ncbi:hypothetical protein V6C27_04805 [Peptococcaceae bacterium 1198_IL3148]